MAETGKIYQVKNVAGDRNVKGKVYQVKVVGDTGDDDSLIKVTSVNGHTGAVVLDATDIDVTLDEEEGAVTVEEAIKTLKQDNDDNGDDISSIQAKIPQSASEFNPLVTREDIGTVAVSSETTAAIELENNKITDFSGEMVSLDVALPSVMQIDYISQINFTSGATATEFTTTDAIKWFGDDVENDAFIPASNTRYSILFYYDGLNIKAIAQGVAL